MKNILISLTIVSLCTLASCAIDPDDKNLRSRVSNEKDQSDGVGTSDNKTGSDSENDPNKTALTQLPFTMAGDAKFKITKLTELTESGQIAPSNGLISYEHLRYPASLYQSIFDPNLFFIKDKILKFDGQNLTETGTNPVGSEWSVYSNRGNGVNESPSVIAFRKGYEQLIAFSKKDKTTTKFDVDKFSSLGFDGNYFYYSFLGETISPTNWRESLFATTNTKIYDESMNQVKTYPNTAIAGFSCKGKGLKYNRKGGTEFADLLKDGIPSSTYLWPAVSRNGMVLHPAGYVLEDYIVNQTITNRSGFNAKINYTLISCETGEISKFSYDTVLDAAYKYDELDYQPDVILEHRAFDGKFYFLEQKNIVVFDKKDKSFKIEKDAFTNYSAWRPGSLHYAEKKQSYSNQPPKLIDFIFTEMLYNPERDELYSKPYSTSRISIVDRKSLKVTDILVPKESKFTNNNVYLFPVNGGYLLVVSLFSMDQIPTPSTAGKNTAKIVTYFLKPE